MMKKLFLMLSVFLLPIFASAHVKWFVDSDSVIDKAHGNTPFYYLTSFEVIVWAIISVLVVVIFSALDRLVKRPKKLSDFSSKNEKIIVWVAEALFGLFLITIATSWHIVLSPDFVLKTGVYNTLLQIAEILAGVLFIINVRTRIACFIVLLLYVCLGFAEGVMPLLENMLILGLVIYFFIKNSPQSSRFKKFDKYTIEILRISVGISLIVLAFTEKLMYPELGLNFLDVHQWNFMQIIGFEWFSNKLFVLSTGFAELIFGIVFIFGYLTRINTILIALFFACSVVTMSLQFGMWEVEDLVVYSAAIIFLMFGAGQTRFFHKFHPKKFSNWLHD